MSDDENLDVERTSADQRVERGEQTGRRMRAWQEWMMVGVGLTGLMSVLAVIVAAAALSASSSSTTRTVTAAPTGAKMSAAMSGSSAQPTSTPAAPASEAVKLVIKTDTEHGKLGPDGKYHDAFLPANFTVHAGDVVKVTVYNYDTSPHSFTSSTLSQTQLINEQIKGATSQGPGKTTFTFTAPTKAAKYLWWCTMPCDPYSMSHIGYMRGFVTVAA